MINDLSLHGQFHDELAFTESIHRVMVMRSLSRRFGRELYCHRNFINASVAPGLPLVQAVQTLNDSQRRALMSWISQQGPFWDDDRRHQVDDWFEANDRIVTDSAAGEAAWYVANGIGRGLVSLTPSDWDFSPLTVVWRRDDTAIGTILIENFRTVDEFEAALSAAPLRLDSWAQLEDACRMRFTQLTISADSFTHLRGRPFSISSAQRILVLMRTLDELKQCFDHNGERTARGHQIYQDHFTGDNAWFSDSSDSDKQEFADDLTFRHPHGGHDLFCPWHGKERHSVLRLHFSWPVSMHEPLFVVYVGPKITTR